MRGKRAPRRDQLNRIEVRYQARSGWWLEMEGYFTRDRFGPYETMHGALSVALEFTRNRTTPTRYFGGTDDGER